MSADQVIRAANNAVRGALVAGPGKKLVVADLANIEGRVAAWLAGEHWKLEAFKAYDEKRGPDLYKVAYGRAFNLPLEQTLAIGKDDPRRQIGKVMELMLQYEGGVGAFLTGAATYGIDLDAMAEAALPTVPDDVIEEAQRFWHWARTHRMTHGLEYDTFIACDSLKRLWRRAHPEIASIWRDLRDAAVEVIGGSSSRTVGMLKFQKDGAWLRMILPSGRSLCYPSPRFAEGKKECPVCLGTGWIEAPEDRRDAHTSCPKCGGSGEVSDKQAAISYMGINQYTRKWDRLKTYGGKLFENATQAVARDVIVEGALAAEKAGYALLLSVHDEVVTETDDDPRFNVEDLEQLLCSEAPWMRGLPLAAEGFESKRYRK